ncbi:MAG: glycosyltransferase [Hamadaea sp.]|uniref:bifunctional polysaccharide deacetylase/glycosyltransferase family 2 protein n=1 Tax=Hamadaea sp. TaxID=2024425 RepID=UPI00181106A8|nr:bifunctional polysaccharide deacetylase/glycosyltransferase family 2 protein [Hamadaea sp.]NUT18371.1 glycosyltransferase [Hamadaea sp.]
MSGSRRAPAREARAHWILLLLALLLLLAALSFNGYAHGIAGGAELPRPIAGAAAAPEQVLTGGPVLRATNGQVESRRMPAKTIALTFDDGPDPEWTPKVLDVLAKYGAHGTFFPIGSRVNEYPDLVRRITAQGNEVGSHTFTHVEIARVPEWRRELELGMTRNAIAGATGREVTLFRPPFSSTADAMHQYELDVLPSDALIVLNDLDTEDWRRPGVDAIVKSVQPKANAGAIVLMHDSGGDRSQTVAALGKFIPALQAKGYKFTTVSEALGLPAATAAPNAVQIRGDVLRTAQTASGFATQAMGVLMAVALVLAVIRLLVQVIAAQRHVRVAKRRWRERPFEILDPVSIIVPAYNEEANIAATVRSLMASDYPYFEVIVVDDGSTDRTADIVEGLRLRGVRVIRQANAGKPAALTTGIKASRANLLILVDGDTVFQPDTVYNLVQGFTDPAVGAIAGNTKVANRKGLLGRWQHLEYVIGFNLDRRLFDLAGCMPTIPGAIGAFRREVLRDVATSAGIVSPDTLAEDTDLTMAVLRAGWKVIYAEHAIAWTEAPSSLRQLWRQRYRWCYGTMQAMWKHRRSLSERGGGGRLGRRGLPYLLVFQIALPLAAPAVDIFAVYGFIFLPWVQMLVAWCGLLAIQIFTAWYALRLDRERYGPLWSIAFQQIVYRQLMYLVVVQSTVTALLGNRLRWQRMQRTGEAAALLRSGSR